MIRRFTMLRRAIASASGEGRPVGGTSDVERKMRGVERSREDASSNAALFEHLRPRPNGVLGERRDQR